MTQRSTVPSPKNRLPLAPLMLACCGLLFLAMPGVANAQADTLPAAPQPPNTSAKDNKDTKTDKDDAAARKAMREERDALLKQRAEMDKRIRELDKKLLGEDFGDDPVVPNAQFNGRVFVMPRGFFAPGNAQTVLPPNWDKDMQQRMQELNKSLRQNFQTFRNGFTFNSTPNGKPLWFGNMPGVNSFSFQSTNDPNRPLAFSLDGIDIDSKDFDKHLDELKKTDPEREKQLRATRDQLREAEQKLQNGLRALPRTPAFPKPGDAPTPPPKPSKYI